LFVKTRVPENRCSDWACSPKSR